jgi:DNA-directed RNA polymerase specialized sigma24 family protein
MVQDANGDEQKRVSQLLADWANRDTAARERLVPIVYEELRRLAHHYMRGEREGHTLQTTALVNEVYLRLAGIDVLQGRLAAVDRQQSRVVELRFFAGLSVKETAEALGVSAATVKRDWATAKLWLYNELTTR